uniref:hypothetical protein n=1 Tax=Rhizobium esperanzae TaxID=1967781 RepID=UPI003877A772
MTWKSSSRRRHGKDERPLRQRQGLASDDGEEYATAVSACIDATEGKSIEQFREALFDFRRDIRLLKVPKDVRRDLRTFRGRGLSSENESESSDTCLVGRPHAREGGLGPDFLAQSAANSSGHAIPIQ